jgi:hypothetical protein
VRISQNLDIAKGRAHRAKGIRKKIYWSSFQYLARDLIGLATAIYRYLS